MGTSTDAILVYGIELPEDFIHRFDEDSDTEESHPLGYMVFDGSALDKCRIETHCSSRYPMHILLPDDKDAYICAWRGSPRIVVQDSLTPGDSWYSGLLNFCEKHNIPFKHPEWLLCSYWG